ncbi:hypothetical protein IMZ31_23335 (plasmid) [Pontibacillus sp. ALD_SL1]|uniref:hypothetical protein n=1 Tax=Pontibacillus sp. ALD_SL1 TaxID=2777185 RepID=UPI001A9651A6|nr:hypothetical protein [Pontibacillus sp. ALD_SL1]QST02386.1 hypothetical protein IMZ31_23335 [Pontibacillus sp. ALD_SL1]
MRPGDRYLHFKGDTYTFYGITQHIDQPHIDQNYQYYTTAIKEDTMEEVSVYKHKFHDSLLAASLEDPHVFYHKNRFWLRQVDDFFGYKEVDGVLKRRFTPTPQGEYGKMVDAVGGQKITVSSHSSHRINPLDL